MYALDGHGPKQFGIHADNDHFNAQIGAAEFVQPRFFPFRFGDDNARRPQRASNQLAVDRELGQPGNIGAGGAQQNAFGAALLGEKALGEAPQTKEHIGIESSDMSRALCPRTEHSNVALDAAQQSFGGNHAMPKGSPALRCRGLAGLGYQMNDLSAGNLRAASGGGEYEQLIFLAHIVGDNSLQMNARGVGDETDFH